MRIIVTAGPDAGKSLALDHAITVGTSKLCELSLSDPTVSRRHCRFEPRPGGVWVRDEGSKNGVFFGDARVVEIELPPGSSLKIGETSIRVELDRFAAQTAEPVPELLESFGRFLGRSPALAPLYRLVRLAAQNEATVLIEGESGTGKELLAEAIHEHSARSAGPFVVVDCGAIPEALIESELFGHERGAFTGADRTRAGAFEAAAGGTIFLDEIGELPLSVQTRLLGVLDRRQFRRVGGDDLLSTDVRVIAATNRNVEREVEEGRFRLDLFHRLAVCLVRVPPLRDRPEDLPLLARAFAPNAGDQVLTAELFSRLERHSWPGNVRELRNHIERLVLFGESSLLSAGAAPDIDAKDDFVAAIVSAVTAELPYRQARALALDSFTQLYVESMLERHCGNVSSAARAAGVARRHFHRLKRG